MAGGDSSDDTIYANGGDDSADGVNGTDIIDGGDGDDTINGGTGTDYLTGGLGADDFRMDPNGGWDVIYDFHADQGDQLVVRGANTYTTTVSDGDTYVNLGNGNGFVLARVTAFNDASIVFV